ncbi:MAG: arylsulfotransferase family protein [Chitinophagales bacterium]
MKYFSLAVVILTIVSLYSGLILSISSGKYDNGILSTALLNFSKFPQQVADVIQSPELVNKPITYLPKDQAFRPINQLKENLYGLTSFWNESENVWEIKLLNLKNDSILHTWKYNEINFVKYKNNYTNCPPVHSLLLKNRELIVNLSSSPNFCRLDANSNVVWCNNELEFHHSTNLDPDGNLWVCGNDLMKTHTNLCSSTSVKNLNNEVLSIGENYMVKINVTTGEIIRKIGVAQVLLDNGFKSIVYGGQLEDPIHLNDIQPVLEDNEYWKKGDLFVSTRHRSIVFLYRPATNEVIKLIHGPFMYQHDVDIISDNEIAIFNNNYIGLKGEKDIAINQSIDSLNVSELIIYNFETDKFTSLLTEKITQENIKTTVQGLSEVLSNEDVFIESQQQGTYYIINKKEVVLKKVFYTDDSIHIQMPFWMRIYEELPK